MGIPSSPSHDDEEDGSPHPTSSHNHDADADNHNFQTAKSLLLVAPVYYFLVDPLLSRHMIPSRFVTTVLQGAMAWRRFLGNRPLKRWSRSVLHDITVAHLLLSLPLVWWFVKATDVALLRPTSHHALEHTGKMTSYAMMGAFVTSHKSHSLVSLVTGLSFERLMPFHVASALLTLWMACLHGIHIAYYHRGDKALHHVEHHRDHDHDEDHEEDHDDHEHRRLHHDSIHAYLGPDPNLWQFLVDGKRNLTGFAVLVSLLLVVVTSLFHNPIRKRWFEFWLIYHITGVLIILGAGIIHGAEVFWSALVWWALDWVLRYGVMAGMRYPKQARVTRVAENVTKVEFPATEHFHYEPGQFVQVAVPSVELWEFHPISIASAPDDHHPFVTLYVRALPDPQSWSRRLYELAQPRDENKISTNSVRIFLEGPYGSLPPILEHRNQHKYSMAVFISGGIGVTPCHSIAKSLIAGTSRQRAPSLQKVRYIWSVRNEDMITAIPPVAAMEESPLTYHGVARLNGGSGGGKGSSSHEDDMNGIELVERDQEQQPSLGDDDDSVGSSGSRDMFNNEDSKPSLAVQTDIYVSQMNKFLDSYDDEEVQKEVANSKDDGAHSDAPYEIHRGRRPDVHAILKDVQAEAAKNGWGRVFVMGCGPLSLLEELEVACQRSETDEVQIDFHQEIFDY